MGLLDSNRTVYAEKETKVADASLANIGYIQGLASLSAQGYNTAIVYIASNGVKFEIYGGVAGGKWDRIKYYNSKGDLLSYITEAGYYYVDISNVSGFGISNRESNNTTCNVNVYCKQNNISDFLPHATIEGSATLSISAQKSYLNIKAQNRWLRIIMTVPSSLDSAFSLELNNKKSGSSLCYSDKGEILQYVTKEEFINDTKRAFYVYVESELSIYNAAEIAEASITFDYSECEEPTHILSMKPIQPILKQNIKGVVGSKYQGNIVVSSSREFWRVFKYVFMSVQLRNASGQLITTEKNLQLFPMVTSISDIGNHIKDTPDSVIMGWSFPNSNNGIVTPYFEHIGTYGYRFELSASTPIVEGDYAEVIIWGVR